MRKQRWETQKQDEGSSDVWDTDAKGKGGIFTNKDFVNLPKDAFPSICPSVLTGLGKTLESDDEHLLGIY